VRYAICAPNGYKIMAADSSQIECRITLQLGVYHYLWNRKSSEPLICREQEILDMMRTGGDAYCWFGAMIYGHEITKATHPVERQVSKAAMLGLGFGMGWKRFLAHCREKGVPMTEDLAKRIVKLYRKTFPNVVKSWKATMQMLIHMLNGDSILAFRRILDPDKARMIANTEALVVPGLDPIFNKLALRLPNGQYLKYPDLQCKTSGERTEWWYINRGKKNYIHPGKVFENVVQAFAGIMMRGWLVELEDYGIDTELPVHDELVALVKDDEASLAYAGEQFDRVMTQPVPWMPELPLAIERHEGYRYGECH
jgi:DNA polymerase I-like protein with 3'-5' exonuclease and polymerase domains